MCVRGAQNKRTIFFLSTFLSRWKKKKVGKGINKPPRKKKIKKMKIKIKNVSYKRNEEEGGGGGKSQMGLGVSSPLDPGAVLCVCPGLCSVRVSCRCVWLIGAEVRKQGCGHLLIIGWKLL